MGDQVLRTQFLGVLFHIGDVMTKSISNTGTGALFDEPDLYTISEGLFLFGFTHWEQFIRTLLLEDVANSPSSLVHRTVRDFHDPGGPLRLATQLLQHPDHPQRFIEWSNYSDIESRANEFLGAGNRFTSAPLPHRQDLERLRRVRNAVAHRSDKAWSSFLDLCGDPPFSVPSADLETMTPGRFLIAHQLNGEPVLRATLSILEAAARHLVP